MHKLNADWHRRHVMPKSPSMEERLRWHVAHARACACRDIPPSIRTELRRRGRAIPKPSKRPDAQRNRVAKRMEPAQRRAKQRLQSKAREARHVPEGWPALIPRIFAGSPEPLVTFIKQVFGATGTFRDERPTELRIGDSMLMVSSSIDRAPATAFLYVYVGDSDATYRRAVDAGATAIESPQDLSYGDRRAMVRDPWGNIWQIATHRRRFNSPTRR